MCKILQMLLYQASVQPIVTTTVSNAQGQNKTLTLNWNDTDGTTYFAIITNNLERSQWLGVGLSLDSRMVYNKRKHCFIIFILLI